MRCVAYLTILGGCVLLLLAARDQYREVASVTGPGRSIIPVVATKAEKPREFHDLMTYEWIRALLFLGLGGAIVGICRRADETDPFSPRFGGKAEVEELGRVLDQEEEKRKHL